MQGWRTDMEDAHSVVLDLDGSPHSGFFGVFDGHGGKEVAKFCASHLPKTLVGTAAFKEGKLDVALTQTFFRIDQLLVLEEHREELKALKGSDESPEAEEKQRDSNGMVINGNSLPDSILEALGMPSGGGFQIRLVRSGAGSMAVHGIDDLVEDSPAVEGEQPAVVEIVETEETEVEFQTDPAPGGSGKRKFDNSSPIEEEHDVLEDAKPDGSPPADDYVGPSAGCTAVCALVLDRQLVVANAGDSRCILSRNGRAIPMTNDHKPTDPAEYDRILRAGGFVADGRVNGSLNLSRALGDMEYKRATELGPEAQAVTALPEIRIEQLQEGDDFLLLACDGIWDVLTNQEAVDFVRERLQSGKTPKEIAEEMCDYCLAPDTRGCGKGCDNMSVVVVVLKTLRNTRE